MHGRSLCAWGSVLFESVLFSLSETLLRLIPISSLPSDIAKVVLKAITNSLPAVCPQPPRTQWIMDETWYSPTCLLQLELHNQEVSFAG